ncbi:MAG: nuclear transport factor 2 family protein [Erysipelotrichaceae bacterium]|nr:nuclear transport factor 2 family protein [Erysipelotrichaceae bacterium]
MDDLKQLYIYMWEAMITKDIDYLRTIHDHHFTLTHMTGHKQNREAYFKDIANDQLGYRSVKHDRIDIIPDDNYVTLKGYSRVRASVYGYSETVYRLNLNFTCEKINGKWMLMDCVAHAY